MSDIEFAVLVVAVVLLALAYCGVVSSIANRRRGRRRG